MAARTFYDLEGNVSELECLVQNINKTLEDWEKLKNKLWQGKTLESISSSL